MQLVDLAKILSGDLVGGPSVEIAELAYDAREVRGGELFFCVPGARADGHDFAEQAIAAGAAALVVERELEVAVPQIVVEEARPAMAVAANAFFGAPTRELEVVGVTGTNGKTTTAYLLYSILEAARRAPSLLGTVENLVVGEARAVVRTTPEAIDLQRLFREMVDRGGRSCALEASSHASELHRLDCVHFSALAFTNLSQDHLDFHGTMERYFTAKRNLFLRSAHAPAAVNVGDPWGERLAADLRALGHERVLTFALDRAADLRPDEVVVDARGVTLRLGDLELRSHLRGSFNAENVLAATACARLLGIADAEIAAGVEALAGVPGRLEPVEEGQEFAVLVDYAHTPDSLERVLHSLRELGDGRVLCVFGCGGDRDHDKRPLMGGIAERLSDLAILTTDNPRSEDPQAIIEQVLEGVTGQIEVEPDRARAIGRALEQARPGDIVLIAGKGHEQGQEIAGQVNPFDDRAVAREALRALSARA